MEQYIADFGTLKSVVHDNGLEFVSRQFQDLCRRHRILTHHTTPYHPRGYSTTKNCLGYPVCRVPTQMATVSGVLPDSVEPRCPFLNDRPTLLRLLRTSCPSSSGLSSTQYCRELRRIGGGPGGNQTNPSQTDPTVQGSGKQTENQSSRQCQTVDVG